MVSATNRLEEQQRRRGSPIYPDPTGSVTQCDAVEQHVNALEHIEGSSRRRHPGSSAAAPAACEPRRPTQGCISRSRSSSIMSGRRRIPRGVSRAVRLAAEFGSESEPPTYSGGSPSQCKMARPAISRINSATAAWAVRRE